MVGFGSVPLFAVGSSSVTVSEGGGGEEYEGPLDIVSNAVVAFGQRAMSAADRGQAVYTIREDDGDTTQAFNSDATTGEVDTAAITTFLDGADGFITSWVNKGSSATNAVQATTSLQPQWVVVGDNPAISFDGVDDYLLTAGDVSVTDEWTVFAVVVPAAIAAITSSHRPICGQSSADYQSTGPDWTVEPFIQADAYSLTIIGEDTDYNNILDADIGDAPIVGFAQNLHLVDCVISIASSDIFIDGDEHPVSHAGTTGTALGVISSPFAIGASGQDIAGTGVIGSGQILELVVYPGIVSAPNRQAIRENIAAAYGITLA